MKPRGSFWSYHKAIAVGRLRLTDWPDIIATLRAALYRGFLSIEYEGSEEAETAVARGVRYLRGLVRG